MSSPDYIPTDPHSLRDYRPQVLTASGIYHVTREHASRTRWHNPRLVDVLGSIPRR